MTRYNLSFLNQTEFISRFTFVDIVESTSLFPPLDPLGCFLFLLEACLNLLHKLFGGIIILDFTCELCQFLAGQSH